MANHLNHSSRRTRSNFAIALVLSLVLAGPFTGTSHAQPAPAAGPASQAAQQGCKQIPVNFGTVTYVPPRTYGDKDFNGHGPPYDVNIQLLGAADKITLKIDMKAWEVDEHNAPHYDFTTAEGTYRKVLYSPPTGWEIFKIYGIPVSQANVFNYRFAYTDQDHATKDHSPGYSNQLIKTVKVVGDTDGDEAGTRTKVTVGFDKATVTVCPIEKLYVIVCIGNQTSRSIRYEYVGTDGKWQSTRVDPMLRDCIHRC